eukprot:365069-Chlamydomonas_euryale.AAC.13
MAAASCHPACMGQLARQEPAAKLAAAEGRGCAELKQAADSGHVMYAIKAMSSVRGGTCHKALAAYADGISTTCMPSTSDGRTSDFDGLLGLNYATPSKKLWRRMHDHDRTHAAQHGT